MTRFIAGEWVIGAHDTAIIAGKDDYCILINPCLLERIHDLADAPIHAVNERGKVVLVGFFPSQIFHALKCR